MGNYQGIGEVTQLGQHPSTVKYFVETEPLVGKIEIDEGEESLSSQYRFTLHLQGGMALDFRITQVGGQVTGKYYINSIGSVSGDSWSRMPKQNEAVCDRGHRGVGCRLQRQPRENSTARQLGRGIRCSTYLAIRMCTRLDPKRTRGCQDTTPRFEAWRKPGPLQCHCRKVAGAPPCRERQSAHQERRPRTELKPVPSFRLSRQEPVRSCLTRPMVTGRLRLESCRVVPVYWLISFRSGAANTAPADSLVARAVGNGVRDYPAGR